MPKAACVSACMCTCVSAPSIPDALLHSDTRWSILRLPWGFCLSSHHRHSSSSYTRRAQGHHSANLRFFKFFFSCPWEATLLAHSRHIIHNLLKNNYTDYLISYFLLTQDTIYNSVLLYQNSQRCNSQRCMVQSHTHLFMISVCQDQLNVLVNSINCFSSKFVRAAFCSVQGESNVPALWRPEHL